MKCKNIECDDETTGNRVYCSLTCRSYYTNKYLKDYKGNKEYYEKRRNLREIEYYKNPKICPNCYNIIDFKKSRNRFCGSSCMAIFNNARRVYVWDDRIRDKMRESRNKYLILNGVKERGKIGKCDIICKGCGVEFEYHRKEKRYCSDKCRKEYKRKDMGEYQKYKLDTNFKFSLNDYPEEFDFNLIEKHGWYSPTNKNDNLDGVSRDHMISIRDGFDSGIDPFLLAHPANCELMIHNDNISKHRNSSITIDELMNKIDKFEKKYKDVYNREI